VIQPLERYLQTEFGGASLLMLAAVVALVWANASQGSYARVWETHVGLDVGGWRLEEDLRHVVNDLLMAVFFYVVALEVKRELLAGSLRDRRSAAVPAAAALGTMVGAALTYTAVNMIADGDLRGWAIPIATDIAFAVGVLGLAGRRAPRELRAFMLTLAVVDDLGTIAVIAIFFSQGLSPAWLALAGVAVAAVLTAQRLGIRSLVPYVLLAAILWLAVFESGVHATIAGVVLGFLTPATAFHTRAELRRAARARLRRPARVDDGPGDDVLLEIGQVARDGVSPLARLEQSLHPWTAYAVLPVFALANAGVPVSPSVLGDALTSPVGLGIAFGLVVGAPIGGFLFAYGSVRVGAGRLPDGLDWPAIGGVTPLKGIGFTIAIFICELAFDDRALQEQSKLAILVASALAALIGLAAIFGRHATRARRPVAGATARR
jgi:NhaA family Na+:H+ antiporter